MSVNLSKGQRVNLDKDMSYAKVGLGWDIAKYSGGADFDLDACAFLLNSKGVVRDDSDFIFYNNLQKDDGSVIHMGDNLTGDGDGDDEIILIDFTKIPSDVEKIAITVTIHDAVKRCQNFGQVSNAFVRLVRCTDKTTLDSESGTEELRFDLTEEFSVETALVVCEIYRHNGQWKFSAVGSGYEGGLAALCRNYGVNV